MAEDNKAPLVLAISILTITLGGLFVAARIVSRGVLRSNLFGWDDTFIIIAWVTALCYTTSMWVSISHGYGKHQSDLALSDFEQVVKAEIIAQVFAVASYPPGKASVAILTAKIFPGTALRWVLIVLVAANAITFYLDVIFLLVQCNPVWKQWTFTYDVGGSCWNPATIAAYNIFTGAVGCISDFVLAAIPWFYLPRLQMDLKTKIGVGFALSAGVFAGCCSILKVYSTGSISSRTDYAWDTIPLVLWSMAELCLINIAASLPTLAPLYQFLTQTGPGQPGGRNAPDGPYPLRSRRGDFPSRSQDGRVVIGQKKRIWPNGESILIETRNTVEDGQTIDEPAKKDPPIGGNNT